MDRVQVVSGVSGGGLVAGLFTYNNDGFPGFDSKLEQLLRVGLQAKTVKKLLFGKTGPRVLVSFFVTIVGIIAATMLSLASPLPVIGRVLKAVRLRVIMVLRRTRSFTLTTALSEVLKEWFGDRTMKSATPNQAVLVLNAVELSTKTAFRFGSEETGHWRFGTVEPDTILLRDAVAASAAHPAFLPALEIPMVFKSGNEEEERTVTLADGGLYDNLGVNIFDPTRDQGVTFNVFKPKVIILCDAGLGMPEPISPGNLWPFRMMSAVDTLFRRVTNQNRSRLFAWRESGDISDLVLAYLVSRDDDLPKSPSLVVRRGGSSRFPNKPQGNDRK